MRTPLSPTPAHPHSVQSHKKFKEKAKLPFTLLSDSKKEVARAFHNLRVRFVHCLRIYLYFCAPLMMWFVCMVICMCLDRAKANAWEGALSKF